MLTALVGYLLLHLLQTESMSFLQHRIDAWRTTLTTLRWTAIALLALSWNRLVLWLTDTGVLSTMNAPRLSELRWRIITWLVLLELVLGQGVVFNAVRLAVGMVS
ncbi:MAG: hypothetical protein GYB33_08300 [Gammaproteobacteria bacterium]|nr:hypothetical protein [Gammaproteobacteria bacterium]